jgi:hypothetical protein
MGDTPDIVAKLRHELERGDSTIIGNRQVCDRALIEEAATLITSLREALEPFAQVGETMTAQSPDDRSPWVTHGDRTHYGNQGLTFGDFRRARNALNPSRKETI